MRRINLDDKSDLSELNRLNPEQWQIDCVLSNPKYYPWWGCYEDYMAGDGGEGLDQPVIMEDIHSGGLYLLDNYNECVNYYFNLHRDSGQCVHCGGDGLSDYARYTMDRININTLTDNDIQVIKNKYLWSIDLKSKYTTNEDMINLIKSNPYMLSNTIVECVISRLRKENLDPLCGYCNGHGTEYIDDKCKLGLQLWYLHPRKGCSRGLYIKNIQKEDLPEIVALLQAADTRNRQRFSSAYTLGPALPARILSIPAIIK